MDIASLLLFSLPGFKLWDMKNRTAGAMPSENSQTKAAGTMPAKNAQAQTAGAMPAKNALCFFLASLIWGTAFVAQSIGGEEIDAFAFCGLRFLMAAGVLVPVIIAKRAAKKKHAAAYGAGGPERVKGTVFSPSFGRALAGGLLSGLALFVAATLQQKGIEHTDVGKAGFLTALYIIIVPCISFIFTKRSKLRVWIAAVIALFGLYFLCVGPGESLTLGKWELSLVACAFAFSIQIMLIDRFSPDTDPIILSFVEFLTAGLAGTAAAFINGTLSLAGTSGEAVFALLYAGIISSGVAYTLQVIGQRGADPAIASLIMSLEAPISAVAGFFILSQTLSAREIAGCALMFAAIILAQLPERAG